MSRFRVGAALAALAVALAVAVPVVLWWPDRGGDAFTADERRSLATLRVLDPAHPLLEMTLYAPYDPLRPAAAPPRTDRPLACSLFVAANGPRGPLFGRNFDWTANPAMVLRTRDSISLVDISYLGITGADTARITTDPALRRKLLRAAVLPFDGMNRHGLAVGMAQVPSARPPRTSGRPVVGSVRIQRLALDRARTVDEAIAVFGRHDVAFDPGEPALHYLIADAAGRSAAVEYVDGRLRVVRGAGAWHAMTNFTLTGAGEDTRRSDDRYSAIAARMRATGGVLVPDGAMDLLAKVAQPHTRWSAVYELRHRTVHVVLDRDYGERRTFRLS
ncbi:carcinine hydrolase/isopenicillin-N N-acyltransferase family protein [Spirillospora sp. NPDC029432]|uniref:carcinine hydrolase/isopenicillin-N N-acyltransferase family protein n=1 Tax=Spirillospora sp. NPDC029432 TaxID=3154599 RepID=UPI003452DFEA